MPAVNPPPRLRLCQVRKRFGATQALDGVDLEVAAGEVHALLGENGAGKSTLMKVLSGAYHPDAGEMFLDGEQLFVRTPRDAQEAGIAMIYQELNLAPDLSAAENVTLGREPSWGGWILRQEQRRIAREALAQLHCDDLPIDVPVRGLSLAQQQMVEIARIVQHARAHDTPLRLLILDEPTSSLAKAEVERLFAVIERLRNNGVSILYISHFLEECEHIADRFTVLRDGRTVGTGRMGSAHPSGTPMSAIVHMMVGREVKELYPQFKHTIGEPVLTVRGLTGAKRPRDVSFALRRGEIFGLAGLVGAGRTETVRAIFGLDRLKSGHVLVQGRSTSRRDPYTSWMRDALGFVSEDRKQEGLLLTRSIAENLTLTDTRRYSRGPFLSRSRQREATRHWMQRLEIRAAGPHQPVLELSGGNQQKVAFGRLLHHGCDIFLLDEPTRGIDIGSKSKIYHLIGELAAAGKAILLVSSYLPELLGICDTIGVVARGRLIAVRPRAQWDEHSLLTAAVSTAGGP